jgi:hypothetical protein
METKNGAKRPANRGGRVRSSAKTKRARQNTTLRAQPKAKKRKNISFQARSNEIHDSLDDATKRVQSGEMTPESARAMLKKIKAVQTLLLAAKRELEGWLRGRKR